MLTLYKGTATIDVATVLGHRSETENKVYLNSSNYSAAIINSTAQHNTLSKMKSFIVNSYTTVKIINVYQSHYKQHSL